MGIIWKFNINANCHFHTMDIVWKRYGYGMEIKNWYYFLRMDFEKNFQCLSKHKLTRSFLASPSMISTIWVTVWQAYKIYKTTNLNFRNFQRRWQNLVLTARSKDPTLTWTGFSTYWLAILRTADGHVALTERGKIKNELLTVHKHTRKQHRNVNGEYEHSTTIAYIVSFVYNSGNLTVDSKSK